MFKKPPIPLMIRSIDDLPNKEGTFYAAEQLAGTHLQIHITPNNIMNFYDKEGNFFKHPCWNKDKEYFTNRLNYLRTRVPNEYIYCCKYRTRREKYHSIIIYAVYDTRSLKLLPPSKIEEIVSLVPEIRDMFLHWHKKEDLKFYFPVESAYSDFNDQSEGYWINQIVNDKVFFWFLKDPLHNAKELYVTTRPYANDNKRTSLYVFNEMTGGIIFRILGFEGTKPSKDELIRIHLNNNQRKFLKNHPELRIILADLVDRYNVEIY